MPDSIKTKIKTKVGIDGFCTHLGQDLGKIRRRTGQHIFFAIVPLTNSLGNIGVSLYTEQGELGIFVFPDPPDGFIYPTNSPSEIDPKSYIFDKVLEIILERDNYTSTVSVPPPTVSAPTKTQRRRKIINER